jgi:hypothetical protein
MKHLRPDNPIGSLRHYDTVIVGEDVLDGSAHTSSFVIVLKTSRPCSHERVIPRLRDFRASERSETEEGGRETDMGGGARKCVGASFDSFE